MVSDCITYSAREDYVKILEKFCNVTIIGSCNNKRAPDDWIWANKEIGRLVATLFRGHCNFVSLKLAVCGLLLVPWELSPQIKQKKNMLLLSILVFQNLWEKKYFHIIQLLPCAFLNIILMNYFRDHNKQPKHNLKFSEIMRQCEFLIKLYIWQLKNSSI